MNLLDKELIALLCHGSHGNGWICAHMQPACRSRWRLMGGGNKGFQQWGAVWSDVDICVCGEECVYALDWRTSELYQEILLELGFSSIHPSIFLSYFNHVGVTGSPEPVPTTIWPKWDAPWTDCHSITGLVFFFFLLVSTFKSSWGEKDGFQNIILK